MTANPWFLLVLMLPVCGISQTAKPADSSLIKLVTVQFRVDMSGPIKAGKVVRTVGLRGGPAPLAWNKSIMMTDANKDGIFEAKVSFEPNDPSVRVNYKYLVDTLWEDAPNRAARLIKGSVLPVDKWNVVELNQRESFQDSIEHRELTATISLLDSLLFNSYNECKLDVYADLFSEDLEFYHDRGGLSTSKSDMVNAVKNNICNKVRRELAPGSIEVSPIPGFGAIALGSHRFHNLVEKSTSRYAKFVIIWQYKDARWRVTRVISLH
ncbi:MAG: nuclear transport factor 2 family protein [Chitinophagaceae bacterium]|nr:nuclear transport factor 2 family protein [Chitinophagaceae bacterium]